MSDTFLTYAEAADLLDLSVDGVRHLVRKGMLPAVRLGHRTVRIKRADIDALPTSYKKASKDEP